MSRKSSKNHAINDVQEKYSVEIRDFQAAIPENKKCFECDQRGPTYVDMTIGSFVCTKCSGMLRGITPPHRIKSISMSSFSMEEVVFLKSRGNVWCGKVWMGLYDKNKSLEAKDDESLKNHIIQKYEKKSYYVDPSTIQQSLSTATSVSHPITTTASSLASSGFIGTTLTQRTHNSSHIARPSSTSSNTSPIVKAGSTSKPNGSIRTGLSGVMLPPPVATPSVASADPFTSSAFGATSSTFGNTPTSFGNTPTSFGATPTSFGTTPTSFGATPSTTTPVGVVTATTTASTTVMESFANFDAVNFDTYSDPWSSPSIPPPVKSDPTPKSTITPGSTFKSGPVMTPRNTTTPSSASKPPPLETKTEAEDKYAALKDLDEIFKSTVVMTDGKSTGTSIFGSSPMATQPSQPSPNVFGPSPTNGAEFPTTWGSETRVDRGPSPNAGWASNWPNNGSTAPINPFTGASNLTQLNTSPWPTTGTSPVQNQSTNNWSNFGNFSSSSTTTSNLKIGSSHASNAGVSPIDPFGAAPAANLQNSENNNDLFAKAPFDSKIEDNTINALTSEIFGKATNVNGNAPKGVALNPWATPPSNTSTSLFHPNTKPNSTNPFL